LIALAFYSCIPTFKRRMLIGWVIAVAWNLASAAAWCTYFVVSQPEKATFVVGIPKPAAEPLLQSRARTS